MVGDGCVFQRRFSCAASSCAKRAAQRPVKSIRKTLGSLATMRQQPCKKAGIWIMPDFTVAGLGNDCAARCSGTLMPAYLIDRPGTLLTGLQQRAYRKHWVGGMSRNQAFRSVYEHADALDRNRRAMIGEGPGRPATLLSSEIWGWKVSPAVQNPPGSGGMP